MSGIDNILIFIQLLNLEIDTHYWVPKIEILYATKNYIVYGGIWFCFFKSMQAKMVCDKNCWYLPNCLSYLVRGVRTK